MGSKTMLTPSRQAAKTHSNDPSPLATPNFGVCGHSLRAPVFVFSTPAVRLPEDLGDFFSGNGLQFSGLAPVFVKADGYCFAFEVPA